MRILIYGLGGVGGYIAAYLSLTKHEVIGVARGEHLKAIRENGLHVSEDDKEFTARFETVDEKELSGRFDVVLFCVKSYDLKEAALTCKPFLDENSIALCLSNGVEHGETLRKLLDVRVLDGSVYILSHIEKAGHIRKMGSVFALIFSKNDTMAALFDEAGLRYKMPENIEEAIWKKYIFISAFAMLTSYYDEPIKSIVDNHYDEALAVLKEVAAIAKARGIDIEDEVQKSLSTASKLPATASTSCRRSA